VSAVIPQPNAARVTPRDLEIRCAASPGMVTRFAVAGVTLSGFLTGITAVPSVAPATIQPRSVRAPALWSGNGTGDENLTWSGIIHVTGDAAENTPVSAQAAQLVSISEMVSRLWKTSGLTGDQIARLCGVSRRAVHLWASGGRINAMHQERLSRLVAIIDTLPGQTPEQRRAALLAPGSAGSSIFDRLRSEHASADMDISAPPWRLRDLVDEQGSHST
jgi:hypothetical protein